jgi:hypothetical protein
LTAILSAGVPAATWWAGMSDPATDFAARTAFSPTRTPARTIGVVGDPGVGLEDRVVVVDAGLVDDIVLVAVDVGVVGDGDLKNQQLSPTGSKR